jgi:hypothetical protein
MITIHHYIRIFSLITGFSTILLILADTAVEYSVGQSEGILHYLGIGYLIPYLIGVSAFIFSMINLEKGSRALYLIPSIIGLLILLLLGFLYVLLQLYLYLSF